MQVCPVCTTEIPDGSKFCHACGWKVGAVLPKVSYADVPIDTIIVCTKCGAQNFRTDAICRNCETDLTPAKMAIAWKVREDTRKGLVTCMVCGEQNPEGYKFCSDCGNSLESNSSTTQRPFRQEIGSNARTLFYLASFFIPIAGFVIGAVFYARTPDPSHEFRDAGVACLGLATASVLIGISILFTLWVAGFVFFNPP